MTGLGPRELPDDEDRALRVLLLCERFHWTQDYVESLDFVEFDRLWTRLDALDRARDYIRAHPQPR